LNEVARLKCSLALSAGHAMMSKLGSVRIQLGAFDRSDRVSADYVGQLMSLLLRQQELTRTYLLIKEAEFEQFGGVFHTAGIGPVTERAVNKLI
jgi:hypothetical protein